MHLLALPALAAAAGFGVPSPSTAAPPSLPTPTSVIIVPVQPAAPTPCRVHHQRPAPPLLEP
ncbi:MAG TPA: hypothetical protein VKU39_16210, partial [Streptosporangiaceae bacterium]|nr:hypothetical protein [Streptosporangiaceae bacterium]